MLRPIPIRQRTLATSQWLNSALMPPAHWDTLASETVAGIKSAQSKLPDVKTPFFVEVADPAMPFSGAFRDLLMTRLTQAGRPVSLSRGGAYRIHTAVRPVPHKQYVPPPMSGYVMGGGIAGISAISKAAPIAPTIAAGTILYELAYANGIFRQNPSLRSWLQYQLPWALVEGF